MIEIMISTDHVTQIIRRAMSDTSYIASLTGRIREIVLQSYLSGLRHTYSKSSLFLMSRVGESCLHSRQLYHLLVRFWVL